MSLSTQKIPGASVFRVSWRPNSWRQSSRRRTCYWYFLSLRHVVRGIVVQTNANSRLQTPLCDRNSVFSRISSPFQFFIIIIISNLLKELFCCQLHVLSNLSQNSHSKLVTYGRTLGQEPLGVMCQRAGYFCQIYVWLCCAMMLFLSTRQMPYPPKEILKYCNPDL